LAAGTAGPVRLPRLRECAGSAAIEFGLAVPLLAILVIGVVEIGFSMYQATKVTYAAEAGLLYAAKNGWNTSGITNAVSRATALSGIGTTPSQYCGCPSATGIAQIACSSTCANGSTASQYIEIDVSLPRKSIIGNSGLPLPSTLSARAILRQN
jgi:Flp pilus assembly protein TadG